MLPSHFGRALVSPNLENITLKAMLMRANVVLFGGTRCRSHDENDPGIPFCNLEHARRREQRP